MTRENLNANQIYPGQTGWTCTVMVVEKHPVLYKDLDEYPFQKRYMNLLLTDMQGTKVKAVIFDSDIDFFAKSFRVFQRYDISNATVTEQPERYRIYDYRYSWFINSRTPVEPIRDAHPLPLPCTFDVCRFADLHKFADTKESISIRGLIVHRFPYANITATQNARDYLLVNEEEIPIVVRLWQDILADYDPNINSYNGRSVTIIAHNFQVKTFHGLSLSNKHDAYILQNPLLSNDLSMDAWYINNKTKIAEWINTRAYENNPKFFPPPADEHMLTVRNAIQTLQTAKTCWIKGKVRFGDPRMRLCTVVCASCNMEMNAGVKWKIRCARCLLVSPMEVRLSYPVILHEEDAELPTTIKTPDAEKLIPSAMEVKELEDVKLPPLAEMAEAMADKEITCLIKAFDKRTAQGILRRYSLLKTYTDYEMKEFKRKATQTITTADDTRTNLTSSISVPQTVPGIEQDKNHQAQASSSTPQNASPTCQISDSIAQTKAYNATGSSAKRSSTFGTITEEDLQANAPPVTGDATTAFSKSPSKKTKGGEKQP